MLARLVFLFAILAGSVLPLAAEGPKGPILSALMQQPTYRAAWSSMLAGEPVPDWLTAYEKTLEGPPVPSLTVEAGGTSYLLAFVCKPNACGDNQLYVLFAPNGAKAWGLLLVAGKNRQWLGAPDQTIEDVILSGVE